MNSHTEQLLSNIDSLKDTLRGICPHCSQDTLEFVTGTQSCHCTNDTCAAWYVTLDVAAFLTLTPEKLATYAGSRKSLKGLDSAQSLFEDKVEAIMRRAEAMKAARDEKRYS